MDIFYQSLTYHPSLAPRRQPQPLNSQHLAREPAYRLLSPSSGTEISCAVLQGTTSDKAWSVMESNVSFVFAATSAAKSRNPADIDSLDIRNVPLPHVPHCLVLL